MTDLPDSYPAAPPISARGEGSASDEPHGGGDSERSERSEPTMDTAGMGARVGAAVLELLLFGVCLGVGWLLWWITLWDHGTTPAKAVLKLRVVKVADGVQPSSFRMAAHEVLAKLLLPLALVTAAVALVDARHRSLWDHVTGTVVVRDRREAAGIDPR